MPLRRDSVSDSEFSYPTELARTVTAGGVLAAPAGAPGAARTATVRVARVTRAQILVGDGAVAVEVSAGGETTLADGTGRLDALSPRPLPALRAPAGRAEPVGRADLVARSCRALGDGRSVQLVGGVGVGRAAVAAAVVQRLAAESRPGAQLLGGARPHTLSSLYTRLSGLFFDALWHEPEEDALRGLTRRTQPKGIIVVTDCDLVGDGTTRLLESFPECVFLFTSTAATLGDAEYTYEVPPFGVEETAQLVQNALGRELRETDLDQVRRAHALAQGRVAALATYAAFLRRVAADPRHTEVVALPPAQQAALLVAGLDEPLRWVLAALGAFGAAPHALFPVLAGFDAAGTPEALATLEHAGLVTLAEAGYLATEDAAAATGGMVDARYAHALAERLCATYATPHAVPDTVPTQFALEVVRALIAAQDWDAAARLARAASAAAAEGGRVPVWSELIALGAEAARNADRRDDLAYFLRQQHTDALLRSDAAAAAALLLLLTELLRVPIAPVAPHPSAPRPRARTPRRLLHGARHAAAAGHGAGGLAAAVAVAAVLGATIGLVYPAAAQSGSGSGASVGSQAGAVPAQASAWTVTLGPRTSVNVGGGSTITVQYPQVTGGPASAQRARVNTLLQQPVRDRISFAEQYAQQMAKAEIADSAQTTAFKTIVEQSGDLVTVVYDYGDTSGTSLGAESAAVVLRKDTATVIPQSALLTSRASTSAGAARLNSLVARLMPKSGSTAPDPGAVPVAVGCEQITGDGFAGPPIAVTATGLTFYVSNALDGCAGEVPIEIPYAQLQGLVNPQIQALAEVGKK